MQVRKLLALAALAGGLSVLGGAGIAQTGYPSAPIRVIIPLAPGGAIDVMVAAAKARTSRSALQVTRAALQMHGAIGYTEEHDIGLYYKRAMRSLRRLFPQIGRASCRERV